ncbi:hypothetical protein KUCAC02_033298 [Chaenocephalus aceratus]|nr:hypothetical protein KUCAC02_033298 [Chaenocephalus aceratus]
MSEQMLTLTTLLHMAVGDIGVILIGKLLMAQTMFMLDAAGYMYNFELKFGTHVFVRQWAYHRHVMLLMLDTD